MRFVFVSILSWIMPGLAQIYAGQIKRGLIFACGWIAVAYLLNYLLLYGTMAWGAAFVMSLGYIVAALIDGRRQIQKSKEFSFFRLKSWLISIPLLLIFLVLSTSMKRYEYSKIIFNPSGSMLPGLTPSEYLVFDRKHYDRQPIQRGDVVLFRDQLSDNTLFVKRVIGLSGDAVETTGHDVQVNETLLSQKVIENSKPGSSLRDFPISIAEETIDGRVYQIGFDPKANSTVASNRTQIPDNEVFLLGDNRDNSRDSRHFGTVKNSDIQGKLIWSYRIPHRD